MLEGDRFHFGHGLIKDMPRALQMYRHAAVKGYAPATNLYATMLLRGEGASKDVPLAMEWFSKRGALGFLDAMNNMAKLLLFPRQDDKYRWGDYTKPKEMNFTNG
jgi:TPR repeat protein